MNYTERIEIQQPTNTRDAMGGLVEAFTTWTVCFAHVRHRSGSESIQGEQLLGVTITDFEIRYFENTTGPKQNMRIIYEGDVYDITAVIKNRRNNTILLSTILRDNQ